MIIAKNSAPNKRNKPAELKNTSIRKSTEWTGLREEITITEAITVINANI